MNRSLLQLGICLAALAVSASAQTLQGSAAAAQSYAPNWSQGNLTYAAQSWDLLSLINTDQTNDPNNFVSIYFEANPSNEAGETTGRIALVPEGTDTYQSAFVFLPRSGSNYNLNEVMRISGSGNVGIGTTSPNALLDVAGGGFGSASSIIFGHGAAVATISGNGNSSSGAVNGHILFSSSTNGNSYNSISNYGGVSVGLSTNANAQFRVVTTADGASYNPALFTVQSGGNVGIATTTPSQTLEVNGTAQIDNGLYFPGNSTPQTTPWTGVLCGGDYAEDTRCLLYHDRLVRCSIQATCFMRLDNAFQLCEKRSKEWWRMKWLLIGLAFCSCVYTGLGCLAQGFASQPISGTLPLTMVALRVFTLCCLLCCFLALFRIVPAVVIIWISAITYLAISWRFNASWVFRDDVVRFTLWTPAFLSLAAVFAYRVSGSDLNSKK